MSNNSTLRLQAVLDDSASSNSPAPTSITLTGYTSHAVGAVSSTDNLLAAIAKLEARIIALEAA